MKAITILIMCVVAALVIASIVYVVYAALKVLAYILAVAFVVGILSAVVSLFDKSKKPPE